MAGKLTDSRIIRVYLIGLAALLGVAAINAALTWWVAERASALVREGREVPAVLQTIASASAAGAAIGSVIGGITTALIARYGLREATANLSLPPGQHDARH